MSPGELQLLAAIMVVIATKYDNGPTDTLSLRDIEYHFDFDIGILKHTKRYVLQMLRYELGWPTPLDFLERICQATTENPDDASLAKD